VPLARTATAIVAAITAARGMPSGFCTVRWKRGRLIRKLPFCLTIAKVAYALKIIWVLDGCQSSQNCLTSIGVVTRGGLANLQWNGACPYRQKGRHRHTTSGLRLFSGDLPRPCCSFTGFGTRRMIPEQTAAIEALGTISGREAAHAVSQMIERAVVQGPGLQLAVSAAARLGSVLSLETLCQLLRHAEPRIRADACRLRPSSRNDKSPGITAGASCLATQLYIHATHLHRNAASNSSLVSCDLGAAVQRAPRRRKGANRYCLVRR
jgi:hypothetical protein